jgi:hypothetical protein
MAIWKKLLKLIVPDERRRADRQPSPGLAAYYWTGGAPIEHGILDISSTGLFLLTEERWYLGTVVLITLQKRELADGSPERSVALQSKVVRYSENGVGLEFVLPETQKRHIGQNPLEVSTDRKSLDKFLLSLNPKNDFAVVDAVVPPPDSTEDPDPTKP